MKPLILATSLFMSMLSTSHACDDMQTAQAVVDYVCDYSLVSNTQCKTWKEDMRQMSYNNQVILDSFISWDKDIEEIDNYIAEN